MNQTQLLDRLAELYKKNIDISKSKSADYAGVDSPFKNFEVIDFLTNGKVSVEEGLLVRMSDKMQRIANLIYTDAKVKDESIHDTLSDLANYSMILRIYLEYKNGQVR